jgi:hypothetical protein
MEIKYNIFNRKKNQKKKKHNYIKKNLIDLIIDSKKKMTFKKKIFS